MMAARVTDTNTIVDIWPNVERGRTSVLHLRSQEDIDAYRGLTLCGEPVRQEAAEDDPREHCPVCWGIARSKA